MKTPFFNRTEAGQFLAENLSAYANRDNVLVLALPRGGVPVAAEVAEKLNAPLDVFVVRKLGLPGHPELAMSSAHRVEFLQKGKKYESTRCND